MKQAAIMRKSYRGVIASLKNLLDKDDLTKEQRKHYTYLSSEANRAEAKRQQLRRRHRRTVRKSRRANRV